MLELGPSFEPHHGGTPAGPTSLSKARRRVGSQFVSQDRRRTTNATNHLAATPDTQPGRSVRPAPTPVSERRTRGSSRTSRLHASTPMLAIRACISSRTRLASSSLVILSVLHSPRGLRTITRKLSRLLLVPAAPGSTRRGAAIGAPRSCRWPADSAALASPRCGSRPIGPG
jgi:hypothetical protein